MGLFGSVKKAAGGLFGGDFASKAARAQALAAGDYGGAAGITRAMLQAQQERAEAEAEQEQLRQLHATIDADPGLSPQDKAYAKANPKAYVDQYMTRFGQVQVGPQGGLIGQRNAQGQIDWSPSPQMPNDTERDFGLFKRELGDGDAKNFLRGKANPPQWVPIQNPDGSTTIYPMPRFGAAPPAGAPQPPLTDEDIRRMEQQGGAGSAAAPAGFRRPY